MNINLPYVKGTREKLRRIYKSHEIRSTFSEATEDKNNIVYEIDCSNYEAVYFGESKRSLRSRSNENKRSVRNCNCEKNESAKHCWEADYNFSWD